MGLFGYAIASAAILGLLLVPLCMKNLHLKASSSCKCKGCTRHNCSVATDHTQSNRADANKTALSAVELPKAASGSTETEGERTEPPAVELPEAAPGSPETEDERAELSVTDPPACGLGVFKRGLTPEEYTEILRTHNQLRKKVALGCELKGKPGPQRKSAKLGDLKWSDEIAITAQNWANGCEYKHGGQRKLADGTELGQNLAETKKSGPGEFPSASALVETLWYGEVVNVSRTLADSYQDVALPGEPVNHYTQLVWAKTTHVGCGLVDYEKDAEWRIRYLVCNYGPQGNIKGEPIY